jgi:hypothetical protein
MFSLRRIVRVCAPCATVALAGCDSAGEGFLTGGTLGALGGMAIGSTAGHMGRGAAVGAVIGAIGGAIIGDQNERHEHWSRPGGCDGQWVYVGGSCGNEWVWRGDRCCR